MHEVGTVSEVGALSCEDCRDVVVLICAVVASWVVHEVVVVGATETLASNAGVIVEKLWCTQTKKTAADAVKGVGNVVAESEWHALFCTARSVIDPCAARVVHKVAVIVVATVSVVFGIGLKVLHSLIG